MLDTNTNKSVWIAIAVAVVALLGIGATQMFPSAFDSVAVTQKLFLAILLASYTQTI